MIHVVVILMSALLCFISGFVVGSTKFSRVDFVEREMIIKKTCVDVNAWESKMLLKMKPPVGQYSVCANLLFPKDDK